MANICLQCIIYVFLTLCVFICAFQCVQSNVDTKLLSAQTEVGKTEGQKLIENDINLNNGEGRAVRLKRSPSKIERETKRNKPKKRDGRKKLAIAAVEKIVQETLAEQLQPLNTALQIIRLETFSEGVIRHLSSLERVQSRILTEFGELKASIGEIGRHTMDLGRQVAGLDERLAAMDRQMPHRMDVFAAKKDYRGDAASLSGVTQMTDAVKDAILSVNNRIATVERRFREGISSFENRTVEATMAGQNLLNRRLTSVAIDTENILKSMKEISNNTCSSLSKSSSTAEPRKSTYQVRRNPGPGLGALSGAKETTSESVREGLIYHPAEERLGNFEQLEREERQHPPSITPFSSWMRPVTEVQSFNMGVVDKLASEIAKQINREGNEKLWPKDCQDVADAGDRRSGIYTIYPASCTKRFTVKVWCDLTDAGGGWTVIQTRGPRPQATLPGIPSYSEQSSPLSPGAPPVDFYKEWADYKWGFGDLYGEYWLGNEYVHHITQSGDYELRIELEDWTMEERWAKYGHFNLEDEEHNYTLHIGDYSGNAGNSLKDHQGASFSTKDRDNDSNPRGHCAHTFHGAWWFNSCHESHLNGRYHKGRHKSFGDGINWLAFRGHNYSLKRSRMMIRPSRGKM